MSRRLPDPKAHRVTRSMERWKRALELIPGGTQLVSRRPSRYAQGVSPVYAERAKGARFWDIDGNEYIDWVSGIGSIILGYADDVVDDAVRDQLARGTNYSVSHELEIELAEELCRLVPCAEMVRYARCGGEACAVAVRIARGATGRDRVLFCGYHGWHDWYLAANLDADAGLDAHLFPGIDPTGVPKALRGTAIPFPYGDLAALGETLDRHRGEVAAVIMEPLRSEWPPAGYLAGVRKLCDERGVLLIFDEVSTSFRYSPGGVQPAVGVTPDLAVFAKCISNGYAMGAVVGRRAVMESAARMFISSTYFGETIGLRAALVTLREIERRGVPEKLAAYGRRLKESLNQVARATDAPVECSGVEVHAHLEFRVDDPSLKAKLATLYIQEMARRGNHGYASYYLNAAQGAAELDQLVAAAEEVFPLIRRAACEGQIDQLLEAPVQKEVFRRIVT